MSPKTIYSPVEAVEPDYSGLDSAHSALVTLLLDEGPLSRAEFDAQAKALNLLAEGSREEINEWAFNRKRDLMTAGGYAAMA